MSARSRSSFPVLWILFLASVLVLRTPPDPAAAHGAGGGLPLVPPGLSATRLGIGRGAYRLPRPRVASSHILVRLRPGANAATVLGNAARLGLRPQRQVYGTPWVRMAIPPGSDPRKAAAAAGRLAGISMARVDPLVRINAAIPGDPFFNDDPDPATEECDPIEDENCDPADMADQWGLFKVGAPQAWDTQRGSPNVVIAVLDSGLDLDHDDLLGNVWTNPDDPQDGVDNDGNGFVDDLHGADFCGANVGDPAADDPASQDPNPDIPSTGDWVEDPDAFPFELRFAGDPAVGDAVDNDGDLFLIDGGVFHGTFVAGIAGAMTDNINPVTGEREGIAGTAWNCKIMPVRIINAEGWGFGSDAAAGLVYAADMGADVINCSWGISLDGAGPEVMAEVQVIQEAILYARTKGCIVVAAAGNGGDVGTGTTGLDFPGIMRETISVGATNWLDQRSEFSSTALPGEIPDNGIDDDANGWIDDVLDVSGPGELIWSTYTLSAYDALLFQILETEIDPGTPTYLVADGTSFSTPLVSGYVALLLSQNPGATLSQIRATLRSNALDLLDPNGAGQNLPGYDVYSGFGRVRMVIPPSGGPGPGPVPPALTLTSPNGGQTQVMNSNETITWTSANVSGGVKIEYCSNHDSPNPAWIPIYLNTGNDGSALWTVQGPPTTQARVRISSVSDPNVTDVSNANFTIVAPTLTVTYPNGGEPHVAGTNDAILWNSVGVTGKVKLEYSLNGGTSWLPIYNVTDNDGFAVWTVQGPATTEARIRVTCLDDPSCSDVSNGTFPINPPSVKLLYPNGGEPHVAGFDDAILWNTVGVSGNVKIEYSTDGGTSWLPIYPSTQNDGFAVWTVQGPPTTQARIRVTSLNNPAITDVSDANFPIR
jgi:subtilisin family serine protease